MKSIGYYIINSDISYLEAQKQRIHDAIILYKGNRSLVAKELGISPSTVRRHLKMIRESWDEYSPYCEPKRFTTRRKSETLREDYISRRYH